VTERQVTLRETKDGAVLEKQDVGRLSRRGGDVSAAAREATMHASHLDDTTIGRNLRRLDSGAP
jgi:hypothetical protein